MKSYLFVNNFGSNYQTVTYSRPHLKGFDMRNLQNNIRICQNPKIKSQCPCQHSNLFYDSDFTYYIFISRWMHATEGCQFKNHAIILKQTLLEEGHIFKYHSPIFLTFVVLCCVVKFPWSSQLYNVSKKSWIIRKYYLDDLSLSNNKNRY